MRDGFLQLRSSGSAHKKAKIAFYVIPALVCTSVAFAHFLRVSFGVYLKHQALVDGYYRDKIRKQLSSDDDPNEAEADNVK